MTPNGVTPANQRKRVAILGGGPAALTAAFELTATPELRDQYEVTVYQLGWRLGGKGASGRNAAQCNRIEEHGLHIWFGFYDNAFSLMRRCYEELNRPPGARLRSVDEAFQPEFSGVQYECFNGQWVAHHITLPELPGKPGDHGVPDLWDVVKWTAGYLKDGLTRLGAGVHAPFFAAAPLHPPPDVDHRRVVDEGRRLGMDMEGWEREPAVNLLELVRREAAEHADAQVDGAQPPVAAFGFGQVMGQIWKLRFLADVLNGTRDWVWRRVVERRVEDKELRFFFMLLDLTAAIVTGIVRDQLWERGFGAINGKEFRQWLRDHGASELTVEGCPLVRAVYSAAFCFEDGDVKRPNVAAGKAAQDAIRLPFFYKEAPMYRMSAGMGDTVFGPLYEVLKNRGVHFEFFHWITRLGLSQDKRAVEEIEFIRQAEVLGGGEYKPLVDVKELLCWPSEPIWDQLQNGDDLEAQNVDFERDPEPPGSVKDVLLRGEDFDHVVLGIPVGALPQICQELADANEGFGKMLANSHTVMTQAFQVWMKKDAAELGFPYPAGALTSCYVEPLDTYCDMSQTLSCEDWEPGHEVDLVAYFCGVLPSANVASQAQADALARAGAVDYLNQHVLELWPHFDWSLLVDPEGRAGQARFDGQYWRANFTASELYAQTPAGSVQYRLWPNQSGFENLWLAGDWTRNGIDGGAVEAAVTSGMLASCAICGSPEEVQGVAEWLTSDRGDAGWVPVPPGVPHG